MPYDLQGARNAGVPDSEIAEHLSSTRNYNLEAARKAGVPDSEIIDHLMRKDAPPSLIQGIKNVPSDVKDLVQPIIHPVQTAKGLYQAASHPVVTGQAIGNEVSELVDRVKADPVGAYKDLNRFIIEHPTKVAAFLVPELASGGMLTKGGVKLAEAGAEVAGKAATGAAKAGAVASELARPGSVMGSAERVAAAESKLNTAIDNGILKSGLKPSAKIKTPAELADYNSKLRTAVKDIVQTGKAPTNLQEFSEAMGDVIKAHPENAEFYTKLQERMFRQGVNDLAKSTKDPFIMQLVDGMANVGTAGGVAMGIVTMNPALILSSLGMKVTEMSVKKVMGMLRKPNSAVGDLFKEANKLTKVHAKEASKPFGTLTGLGGQTL